MMHLFASISFMQQMIEKSSNDEAARRCIFIYKFQCSISS
ncbi:unnamed protein product, partial [Larinioides sclopetarius]